MDNSMCILSIPSLFSGLKTLQLLAFQPASFFMNAKVLLSKKIFKQFSYQLFII